MSAIEDTRKLMQDLIVPDLKALTVRVDALERTMKDGFTVAEQRAIERQKALESNLELREKLVYAKLDAIAEMVKAMATQQDAVLKSIQLERRIERIESSNVQRQRTIDAEDSREPQLAKTA